MKPTITIPPASSLKSKQVDDIKVNLEDFRGLVASMLNNLPCDAQKLNISHKGVYNSNVNKITTELKELGYNVQINYDDGYKTEDELWITW